MSSKKHTQNDSYFSNICIEQCKGRCCNPWWGIISFSLNRSGSIADSTSFKKELIKNITSRKERIEGQYVTSESQPRRLFNEPERQHVSVEKITVRGDTISLTLRTMFAFRCNFLSSENVCTIHPSITTSEDIRPPHCGYMGVLNAKPNEKGYCRIIHEAEAEGSDVATVANAIRKEQEVSDNFFNEGVKSTEEAAEKVLVYITQYCRTNAPHLLEASRKAKAPGRNEPCYCGSGKKFKKCHGP